MRRRFRGEKIKFYYYYLRRKTHKLRKKGEKERKEIRKIGRQNK